MGDGRIRWERTQEATLKLFELARITPSHAIIAAPAYYHAYYRTWTLLSSSNEQ